MRRFEDKVALVTGAASGFGRESAERLASEGARVFCVDVQAGAVERQHPRHRSTSGRAADPSSRGPSFFAAGVLDTRLDMLDRRGR